MGFVDKFWQFFGVETETKEELVELPIEPEERKFDRRGNLVSIHSTKTIKVVVCEPADFDEVKTIADNLKSRRQVVINLERTPAESRQRIIDFVSGTTYALDGHIQKIGDHIFLFAPSNVEISVDTRSVVRSSYIFTRPGPFGGTDF
ncbi:MAG: cell division protein SepF [Syntrophothermus sp.]|uniref:cell division protein SepF n=1 Tax=Syntrophothermus sp. TaxID=2736299 RepID=UPI00257D845A|nr:cell division protein SepF [Syntrophothermus sp.]NSW82281.1 cell division protein SepF [Syntrophothermus sp.]